MDETEVCLLQWLERSGGLACLREQCSRYREAEKPQAVYKLSLTLDPQDLGQYSACLVDMLLHCPRQFWPRAQSLCYSVTHSLNWLPQLSSPSQLLLELRLSSLPSLPGYTITSPSDLPPLSSEPRFFSISGIVLAVTPLTQYTQCACFYCSRDGCDGGRHDNRYIKLHVAGTSEANTVRNNSECQVCGSALVEDIAFRTLASKRLIHLVPLNALQNSPLPLSSPSPSHYRHQATTIVLRDGLCEGVRVGREYSVIGVPVHSLNESSQRAHVSIRLEGNNVFCVEPDPSTIHEVIAALPDTVTDMLSACSYSPWAFTATLAYSFAADLVPPGAYHRLKLAILLSLASCTGPTPLHLLVVATDTTPPASLLRQGSSFSPRSTHLTSTSDLWGTTRKEEGDTFVEGGCLVLASGGVCVMGDLHHLKKEKLERLQRTLETSQIKQNLPGLQEEGGVKGSRGQTMTWDLTCAVWAFCAPGGPGGRNIHESSTVTKALANSMGLVVGCDCLTTDGQDFLSDLMIQHILHRAMGATSSPQVSQSHLHQLLSAISSLKVTLSSACQQLLRSFYLASRRVRSSSFHGTDMPVNALDIMSGLAESHARLSLRSEALEEDGVMAIMLYEESLAGRYGHSVLNLIPAPHFRDYELSAYLGNKFDQQMKVLHSHIVQFCKCHVPGQGPPSLLIPEE